jgi:hypothetical protein
LGGTGVLASSNRGNAAYLLMIMTMFMLVTTNPIHRSHRVVLQRHFSRTIISGSD